MNVSVLLFASLAEAIGRDRLSIEIESPVTAGRLRDHVLATTTASAGLRDSIRVAVNECFVEDSHLVGQGDEVALLPPVAGG